MYRSKIVKLFHCRSCLLKNSLLNEVTFSQKFQHNIGGGRVFLSSSTIHKVNHKSITGNHLLHKHIRHKDILLDNRVTFNSVGHFEHTHSEKHTLDVGDTSLKSSVHIGGKESRKRTQIENQQSHVNWRIPVGLETNIHIYNSLTRKKEPLILPNGRVATWYQCGPTVYDNAHIGHASAYIRTDMIRRVLIHLFNIDVVMVMGVTDIDDKIIKRAKELRYDDFTKFTRQYEASFFRDMDTLKILRPTVITRVTEYLPNIIAFIKKLMDNGVAYKTDGGSVYFDVQKYGQYGRLWTHKMDNPIREPLDHEKKNARDFALWKAAKPGEPVWDSPWGKGRPGWHIECSAMASAIFGTTLDIHSGGDDLRFPHHENEMAQSEACFCTDQWTNYWLHTGSLHLTDDESKMSKSLQNTLSVQDMLKNYTPNQFRLFCMLRPYRNMIEYSDLAMQKAVQIHKHWSAFLNTADTYISGQLLCKPINEVLLTESLQNAKDNVEKALADDFDFPRAIKEIEILIHRTNIELNKRSHSDFDGLSPRSPGVIAGVVAYVERVMDMFGIQPSKRKFVDSSASRQLSIAMDSVVKFRSKVRDFALQTHIPIEGNTDSTEKDKRDARKEIMKPLFQACDTMRDDLSAAGVQVVDYGKTSSWDMAEKNSVPEPSRRKT